MSRKLTAIRGYGASVLTQVVMQILMVITVPLYLEYVGDERYGFWLTIASAVSWMSITDFGVGMALTREIAGQRNNGEAASSLNRTISTALSSYLVIALVVLLFGVIFLPAVVSTFDLPLWFEAEFTVAFAIALVASVLNLPFSTFSSVIEANQKLVVNRTIDFIASFVGLVFSIIYLIVSSQGIVGIALGMLVRIIVKSCLAWWYSRRLHEVSFFTLIKLYDVTALKRLYAYGGYFQLTKVANLVATTADNLVIAMIIGPIFVTNYSITSKLGIAFGIVFASKIGIALFPGLSELVAQGEQKKLNNVVATLLSFLFRLALFAAVIVYFVNPYFIDLWVGTTYFGGDMLNLIFAYWVLFETIIRGGAIIMYANGDIKTLSYFAIAEAVINLGLSYLLGLQLGIVGVALATAISRTLTIGIYFPYFLWTRKIIDINVIRKLLVDLGKGLVFIFFIILSLLIFSINNLIALIIFITLATFGNIFIFDFEEIRKSFVKNESAYKVVKRIVNKYNIST
jgi:O-antigen/teichoic acid export membrane protein